jgi:hypothetical protein
MKCEACDEDEAPICEGCDCCQECCNCTPTDCDCDACKPRHEDAAINAEMP